MILCGLEVCAQIRIADSHNESGPGLLPVRFVTCRIRPLDRGVPAAPALGLAALGAVLFLHADEAQAAAMLADDARSLDALY